MKLIGAMNNYLSNWTARITNICGDTSLLNTTSEKYLFSLAVYQALRARGKLLNTAASVVLVVDSSHNCSGGAG